MNVDWQKLPNAPDPGTTLCDLQDLAPGEIRKFRFAPDPETRFAFEMIVHRHADVVNAYVNQCPHHWLAMDRSDGEFLRWSETELMCTHHSAVFNLLRAGECIMGPCQGSNLIRVPVDISHGQVRIKAGADAGE